MKGFWPLVIIAIVVSVIARLPYDEPRPEVLTWILSTEIFPILAIVFVGLILLTFISWWAYNRHTSQLLLESEFALVVRGENLKPEHFDYEAVKPGETTFSGRPFHQTYIPRRVAKFEDSAEMPHTKPAEKFLSERLRNGVTVALLGQQTDGKTRTIFEVCKRLINYTILRPRIARTPSNTAIQLLKGKNVIIFFDDLEQYVRKEYDPKEMIRTIREFANSCGVIVACRDSEELKAVKPDRPEYLTPLTRFFSDIKERYRLVDLDENAKKELWKSIRTDSLPEAFELFKTVGSICMENGYQVMRDKFNELPPKSQYCIWAIQLLLRGSIQPISYKRLACLMRNIFQLPQEPAPSTLRTLRDKSFLKSDDDPIIPEVAYLRWWGSDSVINYRGNSMPEDDFDKLKKAIELCGDVDALRSLGLVHSTENRLNDALSCFDLSPEIKKQISPELDALILIHKGVTLNELSQPKDAVTAYEEAITYFGDTSNPVLQKPLAIALANKGYTLRELNRLEDEIITWNEITARFVDASDIDLQKHVADALIQKGHTLIKLNRNEEAITNFKEVVTRFGDASEPDLRKHVGGALNNKGTILSELNRYEEAITIFDEVIDRFSSDTDPTLRQLLIGALANKGAAQTKLKDFENAITTLDDVIIRFGDTSDPRINESVAYALINKGVVLREKNRLEDAIKTLEEVITYFDDTSDPALLKLVASALFNKALVLSKQNRFKDANTTMEEIIARFGDISDSNFKKQVADAFIQNGLALSKLNRYEEAITTFEKVLTYFANDSELALQMAAALNFKGLTLRRLKLFDDELNAWSELVTRFGDSSNHELREPVADALINQGLALVKLNRHKKAINNYEEVITRFGEASELPLRKYVASALIYKGISLAESNQLEDAIITWEEVHDRFGEAPEPILQDMVTTAISNRDHASKILKR